MWLTSAGHGTMGFDIPTCMGAIIHDDSYDFGIVFVGDGSFQMNIQELATIHNLNLPIKIFVLDNSKLGVVSQFQLMNWDSDPGTGNRENPSFSKIDNGYGLDSYDVSNLDDMDVILNNVFNNNNPVLVNCNIDKNEETLPMLLGGHPQNEMYPFKEVKLLEK
jgi:acetolactate synthase-1/2/3 large subunit